MPSIDILGLPHIHFLHYTLKINVSSELLRLWQLMIEETSTGTLAWMSDLRDQYYLILSAFDPLKLMCRKSN